MFRALHIAATGMGAQETQLEGISNNIANANTVGYKRERVDFQDLLYQTIQAPGAPTGATTSSPTGFQVGSGVRVVGTARIYEQGALQNTNNPLDVAIEGNGFFVVQQADGTPAYTRAGTFQKDGQGRIVTPEGFPLDPPITIPEGATDISIAANGTVSAILGGEAAPVELGRLTIATFVNPAGLRALGHNLLVATEASGEAQIGEPGLDGRGTLLQGSLERANVEIVEEMIGLIAAQRAYEINTKVITTADEMLRAATQLR
ncbi:MAG TPA: flagellar basal-body rod protein FlgG [Polyangiaceae bacterium]|nr:flagellar basal-body rod protein FlgG [Polyangiaceae bacterium]